MERKSCIYFFIFNFQKHIIKSKLKERRIFKNIKCRHKNKIFNSVLELLVWKFDINFFRQLLPSLPPFFWKLFFVQFYTTYLNFERHLSFKKIKGIFWSFEWIKEREGNFKYINSLKVKEPFIKLLSDSQTFWATNFQNRKSFRYLTDQFQKHDKINAVFWRMRPILLNSCN